MGKLRIEPKVKEMDPALYKEVKETLINAKNMSVDSRIYYDLDPDEKAQDVRKNFLYVAEREQMSLRVRRQRKEHSLHLVFSEEGKPERLSTEETRSRILEVLQESGRPMKKAEIMAQTGITPAVWNLRIRELTNEKLVRREGERRDTVYTLPKAKASTRKTAATKRAATKKAPAKKATTKKTATRKAKK